MSELIDDVLAVDVEHLLELLCCYVIVTISDAISIWKLKTNQQKQI